MTCPKVQGHIPTGCKLLDKYLGGGLPCDTITLVYGEEETGKTTFAMQCAVNCAKMEQKILFIDCDNSFSVLRLNQMTMKRFDSTAEFIILTRPSDFHEQAVIIDQLAEYVTKNFALTVVDTFTSLYRLRVSESPSKTFELNRELNRQLATLAETAKTKKIPVLITSQVHSVLDDLPATVEPVATRVLDFWASTVIALKPSENPHIIRMTLEKNPSGLKTKTWEIVIEESGIHDSSGR